MAQDAPDMKRSVADTPGGIAGTGQNFRLLLLPIEWVLAVASVAALLLTSLGGMAFAFPSKYALDFVVSHYVGGATLVALMAGGVAALRGRAVDRELALRQFRVILSFTLILILHFNFKLWSSLLNTTNYDEFYQATDTFLAPAVRGMELVAARVAPLFDRLYNPYHDVFVAMFLAGFAVSALGGLRQFEKVVTAAAMVLVLGGLAYSVAPAFGPFVYGPGHSELATAVQKSMMQNYGWYLSTGGPADLGAAFFVSGVAAMPSLHMAHAFLLTYYAARSAPISLLVFGPLAVYLATEAVANKFHYLIDLPVGIILAVTCIWITRVMMGGVGARPGRLVGIA